MRPNRDAFQGARFFALAESARRAIIIGCGGSIPLGGSEARVAEHRQITRSDTDAKALSRSWALRRARRRLGDHAGVRGFEADTQGEVNPRW